MATDIDKRHRERMAEKAREAGHSAPSMSSKPSGSHQASSFQQYSADPDAIDISADTSGSGFGKTHKDWRKALHSKCYGYGSDEHTIAKGCPSKRRHLLVVQEGQTYFGSLHDLVSRSTTERWTSTAASSPGQHNPQSIGKLQHIVGKCVNGNERGHHHNGATNR